MTFYRFIIQVHIFFFLFSFFLPDFFFFFFPSPCIPSMASSFFTQPLTPPKSPYCCPCPWVLSSFFSFFYFISTPHPNTTNRQVANDFTHMWHLMNKLIYQAKYRQHYREQSTPFLKLSQRSFNLNTANQISLISISSRDPLIEVICTFLSSFLLLIDNILNHTLKP